METIGARGGGTEFELESGRGHGSNTGGCERSAPWGGVGSSSRVVGCVGC